ncbi:MAG: nucleotidyltransferase domain-containing protein [Planctomycetes bacterium]|nr:nucleotidyltransferase domain-containing protein [Planctomycetota bacterium]MBM4083928.1 nucleotidyltransferase domain-containing protein [Planctomycetota bacterium]
MDDSLGHRLSAAAAALKAAGAREVYVFGSAATGRLTDESDVDLAVAGLPAHKFFHAMGAAGDALGRPIDLIDLDDENLFTAYLKRKGKLQRVA